MILGAARALGVVAVRMDCREETLTTFVRARESSKRRRANRRTKLNLIRDETRLRHSSTYIQPSKHIANVPPNGHGNFGCTKFWRRPRGLTLTLVFFLTMEDVKPDIKATGRLRRADGTRAVPPAPPVVPKVKPDPEEVVEEAPVEVKPPPPPADDLIGDDTSDEEEEDPLVPVRLERPSTTRRRDIVPENDKALETFVVQLPTSLPASLKRKADGDDLKALEPGPIGTLQVHKSGKTRMKLGDDIYDVDQGLQNAMLQQLVALHDDKLVVIGVVQNKLLVTTRPDSRWHDDLDDDDDPLPIDSS